MILETSSPALVLSKKRMGSERIFRCTWALNSEIMNCACTLRILVSRKEVTDCTRMARMTIPTSSFKNSRSLFGMISSIRYLSDMGATKLAALLMTMRKRPIKTSFLLGQMIALKAFKILTLLSGIFIFERLEPAKLPQF